MKTHLLLLMAIASLTISHSAFADDGYQNSGKEKSGDKSGNDFRDDSPEHHDHEHEHHNRWAVSFSPRYYALNSNGYTSEFTSAGLGAPPSGTVGADFSVYWTLHSEWQVGFAFGGVNTSNTTGASQATYSAGFFGLWLAKDFQLNDDIDLAVGSMFGAGSAQAQVITTGLSGQTSETSFTLEPKLVVAYKIAPWMKVGVSGSYLEPVGQSQSIKGNTLTTGHISLHGASGGVEFIFGHFGQPS